MEPLLLRRVAVIAFALIGFCVTPAAMGEANGITGYSGQTSGQTCSVCHANQFPHYAGQLTVGGSTVTSYVSPSYTSTVSFRLYEASAGTNATHGGFNASHNGAAAGAVLSNSSTRVQNENGEVRHDGDNDSTLDNRPTSMSNGQVTWNFTWRAPASNGTFRIWACGNPVDYEPVADRGAGSDGPARCDTHWFVVNSPPSITSWVGTAPTYEEGEGWRVIDSAVTINNGHPNYNWARVAITSPLSGDDLGCPTSVPSGMSCSDSGDTITFTGVASRASYETAIEGVRFRNTSSFPSETPRTVTLQVRDNAEPVWRSSEIDSKTIPVSRNAPATTSNWTNTLFYTENGGLVTIDGDVTLADAENDQLISATVTLTSADPDDLLYCPSFSTATYGITCAGNATQGLTLSGTTSLTNYRTVIRGLRYRNLSDDPLATSRSISLQLRDVHLDDSANYTKTVGFTIVNDLPTSTNWTNVLNYTENAGPVIVDGDVTIADLDDANLQSATVSIVSSDADDRLLCPSGGTGAIGCTGAGTQTLTLANVDSLTNYRNVIRGLRYENTSDSPLATSRTISLLLLDQTGGSSATYNKTVNLTASNDLPVVSGWDTTLAYTENAGAVLIDTSVGVSDADDASLQSATIQISGNYQSGQDVLGYTAVAGAGVTPSWNPTTGTLTLTGVDTLGDYANALSGGVRYENTSENPSTLQRTVRVRVRDATGGDSLWYSKFVDVTRDNDAPVITEGDGPLAVGMDEDGTPGAFALTLNATDVDGDTLTWSIASGAANGTATASGTGASRAIGYTPDADFNGSDSFVVRVADGNGGEDTVRVDVTVAAQPDDPVIAQGASVNVTMSEDGSPTPFSVTLTAADADGDTLTWSLAGAAGAGSANASGTGAAATVTYAPNANFAGSDAFVVAVSDGTGGTDQVTVNVTVEGVNDAPVISQGPSVAVTLSEDGNPTAFAVTLDATDVEGNTLTWSLAGAAGNGAATAGGSGASPTVTYSPNPDFNGADSFVVQVSDGLLTDTVTVDVTVEAVNDAPVIDQGTGVTVAMDEDGAPTPFSLALSASDVDAGDTLTWSLGGAASNGTAAVSGTGASPTVSYDPGPNFSGIDSFVVRVQDAGNASDTITVTVTIDAVNDAPVIDQGPTVSVTMSEDASPTPFSVTLSAADVEDDGLTWSLGSAAANGTATASGTGASPTVSYAPNADFNGADSFTVQVADGNGGTDTVTVNVTVNARNDAPVISQGATVGVSMDEDGSPQAFALSLDAADVDGDTLTWSLSGAAGNGAATASGTGANPTVTYAPNADFNGADSFAVQVSDGNGGTDTVTVNVTVNAQPDAPLITQGASVDVTMDEDGTPQAFAVTLDATDADGDPLTWSLSGAAGNGTATAVGSGASPTVNYMPSANFNGSDSFVVQVSDGTGGTDTVTVNVTVNARNDAPVISQGTAVGVTMDEDGTPQAFAVSLDATDVDGDTLTWSLAGAAGNGTATASGTGASPTVTYAPTADFNGVDSFTVQVADGNGGTDTITVDVTVDPVNDAPVIDQGETIGVSMSEDGAPTAFSVTLSATDVEGDLLSWSIASGAANGTATASGTGASPTVTYTPAANFNGADSFVVRVQDCGGCADTITVNVTVDPVNDAPVIAQGATLGVNVAEDSVDNPVNLSATDVDGGDTLTWSLAQAAANGSASVSGTGAVPTVTYTPNAAYSGPDSFRVQVDDGNGGTDTILVNVTVSSVADAPIIAQGDAIGVTLDEDGVPQGFTLTLNATDADGDSLTWNLDAAAANGTASASGTGNSIAVGYVPNADFNGSDSFVVGVYDGVVGASNADQITVNVTVTPQPDAPVITQGDAVGVSMDEDGSPQGFAVTLGATDADGDTLTWSLSGAAVNGTATAGGSGASPTVTYAPNADFNGADSFAVQVADGNGGTDTVTVNVTVNARNDAPVITQGATLGVTMDEDGTPQAFAVSLDATDVDGGDTLAWSLSAAAGNGTATASGTGASPTVTYAPNADFNGADSFAVRVSDGNGGTDTVTLNVTVNAQPDAPVITQGASVDVSMDEDGTPRAFAVSLDATDVDGEALTWSLSGAAGNGTASASGTGASPSVGYTPNADFAGADSFEVQVSDGTLVDTVTVNVTVDPVNDAPVIDQGATIGVSMSEDGAPTAFSVTLSATDPESDTLTWSLGGAAGNGTASASGTGASPTVGYAPNADFTGPDSFTVQVDDGNGGTDTITVEVTVDPVNDAPVIDQGDSVTIAVAEDSIDTPVALSATDVDAGDTLTWRLATPASNGTASASGTGTTPTVTYTPNAGYNGPDGFAVEVDDGNGGTDTVTVDVTVNEESDPPVIAQGASVTVNMSEDGAPTAFAVTLSATDADGDPLTWSLASPATNGTATAGGTGASPSVDYAPNADFFGVDSFVVQVSDGLGGVDSVTVNVAIAAQNDAPVITQGEAVSVTMDEDGTPQGFAVTLGATDVEGDTLTWSLAGAAGNGVATATGTGASPVVTYTPNAGFNGSDSFVVQVGDGLLTDTVTIEVTINPRNDPPQIDQGDSVAVRMDEDGAPLAFALTLGASDPDGDPLTWSLSGAAANGTASAGGTGASPTLAYTPNPDFNGTDSFSVQVADGNGGVDTVTVNVTVDPQPDAPVITQGDTVDVTMDEDGTPLAFAVALDATDADGEGLSWSLTSAAGNGTAAAGGTGASPTVSYTPNAGFNGADSFDVQVSDGTLTDTVTVQVTVRPRNDPPVIDQGEAIGVVMDEDGAPTAFALVLSATDPEGDPLTWSLAGAAANGTATATGTGTNPTVGYVPNADFNGSDSFVVQVQDANGRTDSITVNVTVDAVNDAPVIDQADPLRVSVAEDSADNPIAVSASDPDSGDTLTWSLAEAPANGAVSIGGGGATPDVRYTPNPGFEGGDSFELQVRDAAVPDSIRVEITVAGENDAPVINDGETMLIAPDEDTPVSFVLSATDETPGSLTWSLPTAPANGSVTLDPAGGQVTVGYRPNPDFNGADRFVVSVSDGTLQDSITVDANVAPVNDPPLALDDEADLSGPGSIDIDVLANDSDVDGDTLTVSGVQNPTASGGSAVLAGNRVTYTPPAGLVGADTFTYTVSDGLLTALATVTVSANDDDADGIDNDADNCPGTANPGQRDNDADGEGDACDADDDNDGMPDDFEDANGLDRDDPSDATGDLDGDGRTNLEEFEQGGDPRSDDVPPQVSAPLDRVVDATGYRTPVDLGTAAAFDVADGNVVAVPCLLAAATVSPCGLGAPAARPHPFRPGRHLVTWTARDAAGSLGEATQVVDVRPLVTPAVSQTVSEGGTALIEVSLNGNAADYPVEIDYTVGGSADAADHDAQPGTLVIDAGTSATLAVAVAADGVPESPETLVITLTAARNAVLGMRRSHTLTLVDGNAPPRVTLSFSQAARSGPLAVDTDGPVTVSAAVTDPNAGDTHSFDWRASDNALGAPGAGGPGAWALDPAGRDGVFAVRVTVTDSAGASASAAGWLRIVAGSAVPAFAPDVDSDADGVFDADEDSDGDGTRDADEGYGDRDGDGIPNHLDAHEDAHGASVLPDQSGDPAAQRLLESEPGLVLRVGETAQRQGSAGALLDGSALPADTVPHVGGAFDFELHGLAPGGSAAVVIPLQSSILGDAELRKYVPGAGWRPYSGALRSAASAGGICPAPGSGDYRDGLNAFDDCIELTALDGGPDDADGTPDGVYRDPSTLGYRRFSETAPSVPKGGAAHPLALALLALALAAAGRARGARSLRPRAKSG